MRNIGAVTVLDDFQHLCSLSCIPEEENDHIDIDYQENMYKCSIPGMRRNHVSYRFLPIISQDLANCSTESLTTIDDCESSPQRLVSSHHMPAQVSQQHSTSVWSTCEMQDKDDHMWSINHIDDDDEQEFSEIQRTNRVADYDVVFVTNRKCGNGRSFDCSRKIAINKVTKTRASFTSYRFHYQSCK
jgi:hypothetical protein